MSNRKTHETTPTESESTATDAVDTEFERIDEEHGGIVAQEEALPAEMTEAEESMFNWLTDLEEFLTTPFVQPQALAEQGVAFTILKTSSRIGKDMNDETKEVVQLLYMIVLQDELVYYNKSREPKAFDKNDVVILALRDNPIRRKTHEEVNYTLERYKMPINNMALREIPAKRKGFSPTVTLCHKLKWKKIA